MLKATELRDLSDDMMAHLTSRMVQYSIIRIPIDELYRVSPHMRAMLNNELITAEPAWHPWRSK
jgi:hypothetical protein